MPVPLRSLVASLMVVLGAAVVEQVGHRRREAFNGRAISEVGQALAISSSGWACFSAAWAAGFGSVLAPGGTLALCDIHPEYDPSPIMLSGEPYLNGYLDKIDFEAAASAAKHGLRLHREVLVEGRLVLWTFQKAP